VLKILSKSYAKKNISCVNIAPGLINTNRTKELIENIDEVGVALPPLSLFEGPTLFLKGENSGYISNDDKSLIEAHFPNATIVTVKR